MDFNQIISQAKKLKEDFEVKREDFVHREFTGAAGGGLVKVMIKGDGNFSNLYIDPKIKQAAASDANDKTLEDLLLAAFNSAHDAFKRESQDLFSGFANMPGASEFIDE